MLQVDRKRVLAYRVVANQLHERISGDPADLAVLDLGVANVPAGSARQALAARTGTPTGGSLMLAWSTRGAPHLHRPGDLPGVAAALWPVSDADATIRIASTSIKQGAKLGRAAFAATASAFRRVVTAPMAKGAVSRAVSDLVPAELSYDCTVCHARHISGAVFQQAGLAGGVHLDEAAAKTVLQPIAGWPGAPAAATGVDRFIAAYLALLGPATPGEVAKYLGTTATAIKPVWPGGLAEVLVDGRRSWLPAERLDDLRTAGEPDTVRLLPPSDPFLQARDRSLLTPDKAREKEVWRVLGNPGALLVNAEIVGTWRAKVNGRRLDLTVTPFGPLAPTVRGALEVEAQSVAAVRGLPDARVAVA